MHACIWSIAIQQIHFIFDIDSCNFDMDRDIGLETENDVTFIIYNV